VDGLQNPCLFCPDGFYLYHGMKQEQMNSKNEKGIEEIWQTKMQSRLFKTRRVSLII